MSFNQQIEGIITHLVMTQKNIDIWEEYKTNIILNFNLINFTKIIENYKPCGMFILVKKQMCEN